MANAESFNRMFLSRIHLLLIVLHRLRDRRKSLQDKFIRSLTTRRLSAYCLVGCLILCSALAFPSASFADVLNSTPNASDIEEVSPNVPAQDGLSQDKLAQFATAYVEVLTLLSDREPELAAAESSDEAASIQTAIEADAVALIESNGLTMSEYMQILAQASQDETFRNEVLSGIDAALQE